MVGGDSQVIGLSDPQLNSPWDGRIANWIIRFEYYNTTMIN